MAELLERTGVPAATIRYYLGLGLLPEPLRVSANRFLYDERHAELLRLIRLVRERRGLSIEAIGKILPELLPDLYDMPSSGVFNPAMWDELIDAASHIAGVPSVPERLVDAGIALFSIGGYADVSIDDVCRTAQIAKGSFYRHFSSKEELFFAAAEESVRRAAADLVDDAPPTSLGETELLNQIEAAVEPYLVIFLDLASLATQRRAGYGKVLGAVGDELSRAAAKLAPGPREALDAAVGKAFVQAVFHAVAVPSEPKSPIEPERRS
ncbi:MAG: TetR family transcriptional regulator [Acidimicrobiales bacterium]